MPKVPFSDYNETRINADIQRRVNLYPNSKRGLRQMPGIASIGSVTSTPTQIGTLDTVSLGIIQAPWVSSDGSLLYLLGSNDRIRQFSLSTPYRISTAVDTTKQSPAFSGVNLATMDMSPSGLKVVFHRLTGTILSEVTLTSAFDIATSSLTNTLDLAGLGSIGTSAIKGVQWVDGNQLWVATSTRVHKVTFSGGSEYTLNRTPTVTSSAVLSGPVAIEGLNLNAAGTVLRVKDFLDDIFLYSMSTALDPSTLTANGSITTAVTGYGCQFRDGDRRIYCTDTGFSNTRSVEFSIGGTGRGMKEMAGILYAVIGPALYSIDRYGTATSIGTIANDPDVVGMATDGTRLVITAGSAKYTYSVAGGLVTITDTDLDDSYTVGYLDQRFYYDQPEGAFFASEQNAPQNIGGLDFASAESFDDNLLAVFSHNQLLYLFGPDSTEVWYSSGTGRPPVDRQQVLQRGIAGRRAVGSNDNIIYFLDDDQRPNKMANLQYEPIYTPALGEEFDSYATVSDCIVNCYTWQQERFAEFAFPTADRTWTYHENSGTWIRRESNGGKFRVAFYARAYNTLFGLDYDSGVIYEVSTTNYGDGVGVATRTVDTAIVTSELYEMPDRFMVASCLSLTVFAQSGGGTLSVSMCTNPGADSPSFGTARTATLSSGTNQVQFWRWGRFREAVFRITTAANDRVEVVDIDLKAEVLNG